MMWLCSVVAFLDFMPILACRVTSFPPIELGLLEACHGEVGTLK
jgi:hypothetical protein